LIVNSIVKDVKLNRTLIDEGNSLNILFLKMELSRSALCLSRTPFHEIVPEVATTPVGQITLLVTFGTWKNFCIGYIQFEVADFKMAYNTFLGRPVLTKFMVIPHYAYLVLKMRGPNGVISIKGDVKRAYNCDWKSCKTIDMLLASAELQDLKVCHARSKTSKLSIQPKDNLSKTIPLFPDDPSKGCSCGE
jgi:hypothetical protein